MRAHLISCVLLVACATRGTPRAEPVPPPNAVPSAAPLAQPDASADTAPDSGPAGAPSAQAEVARPLAPPGTLVDPAKIVGYVMSRRASAVLARPTDARLVAVEVAPLRDSIVEWKLKLELAPGKPYELGVFAPAVVPVPVAAGDRITLVVRQHGGGPNTRFGVVMLATDGSLLLAINETPTDWTISEGKAGPLRHDNGYDTQELGVRFERAGKRAEVQVGRWATFDVDGVKLYLWGSGAKRTLHPGRPPMPDYVGGWLDSAIVRAR